MALLRVVEIGYMETTSISASEQAGTKYFGVEYDAPTDGMTASNEVGIPNVRDQWSSTYSTILVKQKQAKIHDENSNRMHWQIQVDFSDQLTTDPNPLNAPPSITWDFSDSTEPYFLDKSSTPKPCVTSAGELFQNYLQRETGHVSCTYSVNVSEYSPSTAIQYLHVINDGGFTIDGASVGDGQAKMSGIPAEAWVVANIQEAGIPVSIRYRKITYHLKFKSSWDDVVQDRGLCEKDPANTGKLRQILKGTPPTAVDKPWPLDGTGVAKPNATDTPATITLKPYTKMSFASFGFA